MRHWQLVLTVLGATFYPTLCPAEPTTININRFVLGTDVPESPGIMLLPMGCLPVVRGSAPKPVVLTTAFNSNNDHLAPVLALDFTPYYFFGGGKRDLEGYRSDSVVGRLTRVLTKTSMSIARLGPQDDSGATTHLGIGIRATFHDPHDPVLNSSLPESIAAELSSNGLNGVVDPSIEDVTDYGTALDEHLAHARREMRQRRGLQVSGGFGELFALKNDSVSKDSLNTELRLYWLSTQITIDGRFDVLITGQLRDYVAFDSEVWAGAAILRKMNPADLTIGAFYDSGSSRVFPFAQAEIRALQHLQVLGSLAVFPKDKLQPVSVLSARLGCRLYVAFDR